MRTMTLTFNDEVVCRLMERRLDRSAKAGTACAGSVLWMRMEDGAVYCSQFPRGTRGSRLFLEAEHMDIRDVEALGHLGILDAKKVKQLRAAAQFERDRREASEWLREECFPWLRAHGLQIMGNAGQMAKQASKLYAERKAKERSAGQKHRFGRMWTP